MSRDTLNDRIYNELRRALMAGAFEPGQKLSIRNLASSLGTSAMPVRDALRRLITERALESQPNRTIAVPQLDAVRIQEIYKIRVVLEGLAASEAAKNISRHDVEALETLERDMERALSKGDIRRYTDLNWQFHFAIYRASRMPQLVDTIETFWLQIGPVLSRHLPILHEGTISDDHNQVISALGRRDGRKAKAGISADLNHTCAMLVEALSPPGRAAA
ncbi:MAG: GntR family transcriptional regulator [Phenylobacterium sp.]